MVACREHVVISLAFFALLRKAGKGHVELYLPRIELGLCSSLSIRKFVRVMSLILSAFLDAYMYVVLPQPWTNYVF
jgi:hypothetical protein